MLKSDVCPGFANYWTVVLGLGKARLAAAVELGDKAHSTEALGILQPVKATKAKLAEL